MEKEIKPKSSSYLKRLFWNIAGVDIQVIEHVTIQEQNRYFAIGVIILFTSSFAAISGGYAIYSTFLNLPASILIAISWGLVILSINRLLISTTQGKSGNVREKILFSFPRLMLSVIIVLMITKPIELFIFKDQIAMQLMQDRLTMLEEFQETTRSAYGIDEIQSTINTLNRKIIEVERNDSLSIEEVRIRVSRLEIEKDKVEKDYFSAIKNVEEQREMQVVTVDRASISFIAQLAALQKLKTIPTSENKSNNVNNTQRTIFFTSMFITLFFLIIDIIPFFIWILSPAGLYEKLIQKDEDDIIEKRTGQKKIHSTGLIENVKLSEKQVSMPITNETSESVNRKEVVEVQELEKKLNFIGYINTINEKVDDEVILLKKKSEKLLMQGLIIIFIGIFLYGGMLFIWLNHFQNSGFQTYHLYGIVSTSLLFLFFEFLGGWFLKQHNNTLNSSTYLNRSKPNVERYLLTFLAIQDLSKEEMQKEYLNNFIELLKKDIIYPDSKVFIATDSSFAKEAVDALNSFKGSVLNQGK